MTKTGAVGLLRSAHGLTVARAEPPWQPGFHGLIGRGPAMQGIFAAMRRFAPHAHVVLITGEVGTGKALLARTLHHLGPHDGGPFVEVRCADGAHAEPFRSLFGAAEPADETGPNRGTVFVDDVDELPWTLQSQLLEWLEAAHDRTDDRPGPGVHIIAATIRDLPADVAAGRFRSDLFYRLNAFELRLPPLRERLDDVAALATAFVQEAGARLGRPAIIVTAGAARLLQTLPWPGNLRELRNVLDRACILSDDATLDEGDIRAALATARPHAEAGLRPARDDAGKQDDRLDEAKRAHVRAVLDRAHGNKSIAARHLGVSRRSLYRLIERLRA